MALEEKDVFLNRQDIVGDAGFDPRTSAPRSLLHYQWAITSLKKSRIYLYFFFLLLTAGNSRVEHCLLLRARCR